MESNFDAFHLSSPSLTPASGAASKRTEQDNLNLKAVVRAKVIAGRARRKSWFEAEKRENDIGVYALSHADYPTPLVPKDSSKVEPIELGFDKQLIYEILEHVVKQQLQSKIYDPGECERLCKQLANTVKDRISALEIKNFKIICTFFVSKKAKPSITINSGCAWDELVTTIDRDSFVEYVFQNDSISVVGTAYLICCEKASARQIPRSSSLNKRTRASSFH